MIGIVLSLLILLGMTCVIEMIPLLFFKNGTKLIKTSLLCNLITNPLLNTILGFFTLFELEQSLFIIITLLLEVCVIIFEAFIYYNTTEESKIKCFFVSLITNLLSFGLGLLLFGTLEAISQPRSSLDPLERLN